MTMLVTLEQAKDHLRVDHDEEDLDIELKVHSASGAVLNYLKSAAEVYFDSSGDLQLNAEGEPDVPFQVKASVLIMLGILYRERDGAEATQWQMGYLPSSVVSLLYPLRDPALA